MSLHGTNTSRWRFSRALLSGAPSQSDEVNIAYIDVPPAASPAKGTILLIHGFPETSHQFRHVINPLADQGYRIIAPDYRGHGSSSRPTTGYDKHTLAADLHTLLQTHLNITDAVHVVGHDIGGMVAHAYAALFPKDTKSLMFGECPLPGSNTYEKMKNSPPMWHFTFHNQLDLPELLVTGHETQYLTHFYQRLCIHHDAISPADINYYASVYTAAGGFRAGFNTYRAFSQDAADNYAVLEKQGKSKVPCCALNGDGSLLGGENAKSQCEQYYESVECRDVKGSGHWCAEENPESFVEEVLAFVGKH